MPTPKRGSATYKNYIVAAVAKQPGQRTPAERAAIMEEHYRDHDSPEVYSAKAGENEPVVLMR
jgi:hypothetical protein